jgi:hypothetical protein
VAIGGAIGFWVGRRVSAAERGIGDGDCRPVYPPRLTLVRA